MCPRSRSRGKLQIAAVADALTSGGPRDVVAISAAAAKASTTAPCFPAGAKAAKSPTASTTWRIPCRRGTFAATAEIQLPDEFAGHLMVFRTFEKVSYALVMEGINPSRSATS